MSPSPDINTKINILFNINAVTDEGWKLSDKNIESMLFWDVNNGIARRNWARNPGAINQIKRAMKNNSNLKVTLPNLVDDKLLKKL